MKSRERAESMLVWGTVCLGGQVVVAAPAMKTGIMRCDILAKFHQDNSELYEQLASKKIFLFNL